jgi:hypothetical protein
MRGSGRSNALFASDKELLKQLLTEDLDRAFESLRTEASRGALPSELSLQEILPEPEQRPPTDPEGDGLSSGNCCYNFRLAREEPCHYCLTWKCPYRF